MTIILISIEVNDRTNIKKIKTIVETRSLNIGKISIIETNGTFHLSFNSDAGLKDIELIFSNEPINSITSSDPILLETEVNPIMEIINKLPKRFSIYPPMLLLPPSTDDSILKGLSSSQFESILQYFTTNHSPKCVKLTHLAINRPIPIEKQCTITSNLANDNDDYNSIRSPSQMTMLYGNFNNFWVSTIQNGIFQTWMPYYTMFSRGNIKEKSRILNAIDFPNDTRYQPYSTGIVNETIFDLYVGIGYFTLSYLSRGARRVVCWDINPKSVEGLIKGVLGNKFGGLYHIKKGEPFLWSKAIDPNVRCIVFEESNEMAMNRMMELINQVGIDQVKSQFGITHFNLGMLPSSKPIWKLTCELACKFGKVESPIWIHVHDNVATEDIETWQKDVENYIHRETSALSRMKWVEHVKTYAPEVWHLVGDVEIDFTRAEKMTNL